MMMRYLVLFLLVLCGCGIGDQSAAYRIGVDPSWYPLDVKGREANLLGFTKELLQEISRVERTSMVVAEVSTANLFFTLKAGKVQGIVSLLYPYPFNQSQYSFSKPFLLTGPVLVVASDSKITSMEMLKGKEISLPNGTSSADILAKYPGIYARFYDQIPNVLAQVAAHEIDGAVIDVLPAQAYCRDLFQGALKIVTPPLNDDGLRVLTLQGQNEELIATFCSGLDKLKDKGKYDKLLQKWGLIQ